MHVWALSADPLARSRYIWTRVLSLESLKVLTMQGTLLLGTPPPFGHSARKLFAFDPMYINLNHGSFGSVPRYVTVAVNALDAVVESNPDRFVRLEYEPALTRTRERLARIIGAKPDECVLVPNVALAVNTVLHNIQWAAGDTIIISANIPFFCPFLIHSRTFVSANLAYDSILRAVQHICDTTPKLNFSCFEIKLPQSSAEILERWKQHIKVLKERDSYLSLPTGSKPKIVATFDSITAGPAIILPWREMAAICKEEGVLSIVDAAHSLGQEANIRLEDTQPDFWVSVKLSSVDRGCQCVIPFLTFQSCSKWMYAKRACAVLYVPRKHQDMIKSALQTSAHHPSHQTGEVDTFPMRFFFPGTLDVTIPLSVNHALDFHEWLGGEKKINEYCHQLAVNGGRRLAEVMGTAVLEGSEEQLGNMANVELPLPSSLPPSFSIYSQLKRLLLDKHHIYATQFYHNGKWYTRVSAQIFNEVSDFEKLGAAWLDICREQMVPKLEYSDA
ncbi:pyridoxal phosphate-dependent transferase [Mycena metata]|uniref:Pyridoxal phosphate-dependent transferase n=1 Tax=Mycena metata TaxID=1033252 RepID=A0AAD7HXP0_9AGAR|nr:pyridoxal phosphate-dependent transferase [Mycena metata]KAJ7729604.1 pyridoxal phosphate-dependent transferase [Mycena metata]KAJ7729609.1 pyridoxal phosphate-dependent transferase [Mycena metata]